MNEKLEKVRSLISEWLNIATSPVLLCSFGKDSMLLLSLIREVKDIPLIWYRSDLIVSQREFAERIIIEWDLTVFGYAPAVRYFLPNGNGLSLINDYSMSNDRFPVVVDVEHSDRCCLTISQQRTPFFSYDFDVTFTGYKNTDTHLIFEGLEVLPEDGFQFGGTKFYAPLRDLTDEDVWTLIRELKVPFDEKRYAGNDSFNPDLLLACTRCLQSTSGVFCPEQQKEIPAYQWDKQGALDAFRARFIPQGS